MEVTAQLKVDEPSARSRGALLAMAAALAVVVMEDGWFTYPIADSWLNGYSHLIRLVMFGLIGWTVEDVVNVPPKTTVRIAWYPDDRPGMWMYHCHILEHHAAGMMAHFEVKRP